MIFKLTDPAYHHATHQHATAVRCTRARLGPPANEGHKPSPAPCDPPANEGIQAYPGSFTDTTVSVLILSRSCSQLQSYCASIGGWV
eukprot:5695189-Pyramimonas_sp.AAC.1